LSYGLRHVAVEFVLNIMRFCWFAGHYCKAFSLGTISFGGKSIRFIPGINTYENVTLLTLRAGGVAQEGTKANAQYHQALKKPIYQGHLKIQLSLKPPII